MSQIGQKRTQCYQITMSASSPNADIPAPSPCPLRVNSDPAPQQLLLSTVYHLVTTKPARWSILKRQRTNNLSADPDVRPMPLGIQIERSRRLPCLLTRGRGTHDPQIFSPRYNSAATGSHNDSGDRDFH